MSVWNVPKLWRDGFCWIIGGGPSLTRQFGIPKSVIKEVTHKIIRPTAYSKFLQPIHDHHVIGVNNAYQIGQWIDSVFFGDCTWYLVHRKKLSQFAGLKVTCCPRFEARPPEDMEGIKYLRKDRDKHHGISSKTNKVAWNHNSGAAAINLAVHLGVTKIFLLGFDMKLDDESSVSHWHGSHGEEPVSKKHPPFTKHLQGFPSIKQDANELGVDIFNVNPQSAIEAFPKITLKDALCLL